METQCLSSGTPLLLLVHSRTPVSSKQLVELITDPEQGATKYQIRGADMLIE